jgi:hypothetical protein
MKNVLRKQLKKCWKNWKMLKTTFKQCWTKLTKMLKKKLDTIPDHPNNYTDSELFWKNLPQYSIPTLIRVPHWPEKKKPCCPECLPHRSGKGLYRFYVSINGSSHSSINGSVEGSILAGLHVLFAIKYGSVLQFFPETNSGIAHLHLRVFMPSLSSQHTRLKQWFGWQHTNLLDVRISIHVTMFVQMTLDESV